MSSIRGSDAQSAGERTAEDVTDETPAAYVERAQERFIEEWRTACRLPSISATGDPGLAEMAAWTAERAAPLFDSVELVETTAAPVVLARLEGTGPRTLLLYSHYDVQPVEPLTAWTVPPFEGVLRDGRLVARGACDDKADVVGRLQAIEAWQQTRGRLPFSIVWLCEGSEEIGSAGLGDVIEARRDLLEACDWCLWESFLRRSDGRPEIGFGCRGLLYVELSLRRLVGDQHSAFASIYRSAAAELVRALSSLTDKSGVVTIEGFHDAVVVPRVGDEELAASVSPPAEEFGVDGRSAFLTDDDTELRRRLLFEPTANIAGLLTGHTGPGAKTVLPAEAVAKVDFRLVPDQQPADIADKLRRHLDAHGFGDIELTVLHSNPPAASPTDSPLAVAAIEAAEELQGAPVLYPIVAGSGPLHHVVNTLGIPTVMPPGATRLDSSMHGPDENARVDDYLDLIRFTLGLFERLA